MTMEVGKRLKSERETHGITQKTISEITGLTARGYRRYEQEDDTFLSVSTLLKLEPLGMDIFYIIFGERSMNTLTADEKTIIESYRAMSPRERAGLLGMVTGLQSLEKGTRVKGNVNQYVDGNVSGHYAQGNVYAVHIEKKPS